MRTLDLLPFGKIKEVIEKRVHGRTWLGSSLQLKVSLAFWIGAFHVVERRRLI
jgi:hypothetical protein